MAAWAGSPASVAICMALILVFNCWWSLTRSPSRPADVATANSNHSAAVPVVKLDIPSTESGHIDGSKTKSSTAYCDLSGGEWVPDSSPLLYTNNTCKHIHHAQNCLQNGRPDIGYLHWKWRPFDCELPQFDAARFLERMRGKKLAFIGDSLARNQMQSLHCTLAQVEESILVYSDPDDYMRENRCLFPSYNFTLAIFGSRFLVKSSKPDESGISKIYLDVPDMLWKRQLAEYDVVVVSAGYWYFTDTLYYIDNTLWGESKGLGLNVTTVEIWLAMAIALANVLKYMMTEYKGIVVLRTMTVDHFENGTWSTGGACKRMSPYSRQENGGIHPMYLWINRKINEVQIEEFEKAKMAYAEHDTCSRLKLLDITYSAFLRPDGHPGPYRKVEPGEPVYDCLHWCLPGPIDMWNQLLLHALQPIIMSNNESAARKESECTQKGH
ncbi:hypothetical protein GOP47_0018589 [Adiantum capillus-veneris]|uniref:Trichome birefringence-like N-terminal domain-containing protein n=1 Tax=Adiantum capillus-veneris TaxID=13818 RepID=A0A9D4Z9R7_ADICA|nr:hypothetical protein GOP47_0018589 [Adiantum capillus-veneris]